jgi:hypothetical protein
MMANFDKPNPPINLESAKNIIENANGLKFGQNILFAACEVGKGKLAQNVSDLNKSTVFAPNGFVSFLQTGDNVNLSVWEGLGRNGSQGNFLRFTPGGSGGSISGSIKSIDVNLKSGNVRLNFTQAQSVTGSNIKVRSIEIKGQK